MARRTREERRQETRELLLSAAERTTHWDGVRNFAARNFMRDGMKIGDQVFFYHSSVNPQAIVGVCEVVREAYPEAHLTIGLSNISFGLPGRSFVNRYFLGLAIQAGLDSAILDPLDREIQAAIVTNELILGRDAHCLNFIRASRKGLFDKPTE